MTSFWWLIINFEQFLDLALVFPLLTLHKLIPAGLDLSFIFVNLQSFDLLRCVINKIVSPQNYRSQSFLENLWEETRWRTLGTSKDIGNLESKLKSLTLSHSFAKWRGEGAETKLQSFSDAPFFFKNMN